MTRGDRLRLLEPWTRDQVLNYVVAFGESLLRNLGIDLTYFVRADVLPISAKARPRNSRREFSTCCFHVPGSSTTEPKSVWWKQAVQITSMMHVLLMESS